jgi:N-acetylglucosaminyl-diphospho-decaprenol L-rhamnosyltransferase
MIQAHHESARRFLDKKYSGPLLWPVRFALRLGLGVRSALIKRRMSRG